MNLLELDGVAKHFGGVAALDGCSFSVRKGEWLGLIGPNGAGKSTLFEVITGFYAPTSGSVVFNNEDITGKPPHEIVGKGVVRTFQLVRVLPKVSALENVMAAFPHQQGEGLLNCLSGAWKKQERELHERALELLEFVGLGEKTHFNAAHLSYGQQKLLTIARSLAMQPRLLLLDEPFAGLNPVMANKVSSVLRELHSRGLTLVLVEHNVQLITSLCQRIVALDEGKVIAQGKPREVVRNPLVVEAYLGSRKTQLVR